jgi:hypothetical protein
VTYEPIMAKPRTWDRYQYRSVIVGAALLLFGLLVLAKAIYLQMRTTTTGAVVVAESTGKAAFVRVRLDQPAGREAGLSAWTGEPRVGRRLTVVYDASTGWAKESVTFAPFWLWILLLGGALFVAMPWLTQWTVARSQGKVLRRPPGQVAG